MCVSSATEAKQVRERNRNAVELRVFAALFKGRQEKKTHNANCHTGHFSFSDED